jgi:hypothetical protein
MKGGMRAAIGFPEEFFKVRRIIMKALSFCLHPAPT